MVADVPASLWALLLGTTVVGGAVGVGTAVRAARLRGPALAGWSVLAVVATAALLWHALYLAALSGPDGGPVIPVLDWLFTSVPAVLAGLLVRRRTGGRRRAAALASCVLAVGR